jgi:hypothetical protein
MIKQILNHLVEKFNIFNIVREGNFVNFWVEVDGIELPGEIHIKEDYRVVFYDRINLLGDNWSKEEIQKQKAALRINEQIDKSIKELVTC